MIFRILPVLLALLAACSHRLPRKSPENTYRLVSEVSDDLQKLKKAAGRSKVMLEIDFETGRFNGRYKDHDFTGNYTIEHVSAGFVKGFFYRVKLGDLKQPESKNSGEQAFFEKLAAVDRFYVAPDRPANPSYTILELRDATSSGTKLLFIRLNP